MNTKLLKVENDKLVVFFDSASGMFGASERKTPDKPFLVNGVLEGSAENARVTSAKDRVFGNGKKIVVGLKNGGRNSLELYPRLPFILVRGVRVNKGRRGSTVDIRKAVPATFTLDLGKPASELKTVGTGGLLEPHKNPGSYLFLTCADPATRRGVVAGWITQDRGSGVFFSSVENDKVGFRAQIDYGHLRIPAGESASLETLAIGCFDDARIGTELYAEAIRKQYRIKLPPPPAVYCTWYAEKNGCAGDEVSTVELARFAAKELKPFGFEVVQIDDEWQDGEKPNGPRRGFERVRPDGPYPHGIAPVAAEVKKLGLTFGIWWLPFGRNYQAPDYKDRQHWFVKRTDGTPYDTPWGATCLDLTHPEVRKHLATLAALYRTWGVDYYKMDGLWTGAACEQIYVNDGYRDDNFGNTQPFHDPLKTNIEMFRDGLKFLRRSAGNDVFFSGCCVSQNMREMTAIGLVDSMRIGPDAGGDLRVGPIRGSRLYFLNGQVWWNDPDPAVLRAAGSGMGCNAVTLEQARMASSWPALTGQFYLCSDWLPDLPAERLDIMKKTMWHHDAVVRPVDYFDNFLPTMWLVTDTGFGVRRDVIGIFNFEGQPLKLDYSCEKIGLDKESAYHAFDFWADKLMPDFKGSFTDEVAPNSCRIVAVRANEGHPVVLSTSAHVTQGMVDVSKEAWNGRTKTLSGVSKVVADYPYELRIAGLTDGGREWTAKTVVLSGADAKAGVKASLKKSRGILRVRLSSPCTREVRWSVKFSA